MYVLRILLQFSKKPESRRLGQVRTRESKTEACPGLQERSGPLKTQSRAHHAGPTGPGAPPRPRTGSSGPHPRASPAPAPLSRKRLKQLAFTTLRILMSGVYSGSHGLKSRGRQGRLLPGAPGENLTFSQLLR